MGVFFIADTHFGEERTLQLWKRPFSSVTDMDRRMIANWNGVVSDGDTVHHLGDFGFYDRITGLNGNIIFLPGNYDDPELVEAMSKTCEIIEPNTVVEIDGNRFQLVHEPDEAEAGKFFLFGHIHKSQMVKRNGLNVGVDCHNFYPIDLETVLFWRNAIENHYDENVFLETLGGGILRGETDELLPEWI